MLGPDHRGRSEQELSELPFLVLRQAPLGGLPDPGTTREVGDDGHSTRRQQGSEKVEKCPGPRSLQGLSVALETVGFVECRPVPSAFLPTKLCPPPESTHEATGQRWVRSQPFCSPGPLETLSVARLLTWAQNLSTEACFEFEEFHSRCMCSLSKGGFRVLIVSSLFP